MINSSCSASNVKVRPEIVSVTVLRVKNDPTLRILETDTWPSALADLSADARSYLETQNAYLTTYNIELGYDYWTAGSFGHIRPA